jgi:glutamate racemase
MEATPISPASPIAVFDSGVGGLTVLHELLVWLPSEDYVYLGDTAHFPYGARTDSELRAFSVQIAEHLLAEGAKLLVVACNSASAAALETLEQLLERTAPEIVVIGVLTPAAQVAVVATRNGRIGLLATPATVANGGYERAISAADPHVVLESVACPDLAPIIQSGFPFDEEVVATVREYCAPLVEAGVDTVILGSTHYPLCAPMLQRMLGREVTLVSAGTGVARSVERALAARALLAERSGEGTYRFQCTGDADAFRAVGTRFLQLPLGLVEQIALPDPIVRV